MSRTCPCTSGKTYDRCFGPFIEGAQAPATAEQLMRSRFSAYALGIETRAFAREDSRWVYVDGVVKG